MILGPWTHGVAAVQRSKAGDRDFGAVAALDYNEVVLTWMDRHLKGLSSVNTGPPVRVFVMGANRWRESDRWPWAGLRSDTLYLAGQPGSGAARRLTGQVSSTGKEEAVIRSDPAHPVNDPFGGKFGAHDYRALKAGLSIAVFETEPFRQDTEIIGQVVVDLVASATVPDFDLWAQLFDVAPNGTAWNLSTAGTALQRASYRGGGPQRRLVRPGETVRLRMDGMVTANRFLKGHRLRLIITPQFYPLFSVNPQTGAQELESESVQPGDIRIRAGSRVILPMVGP